MLPWIIGVTIKSRKKSKENRMAESYKICYDDITDDDIEVLEDGLIFRAKMKNKCTNKEKFSKAQYEVLQVCFL